VRAFWAWRVAGWCALLLFAGVQSPVGPETAFLLGLLDRDHQAVISGHAQGFQLVLRHSSKCIEQRHWLIARTLTLSAKPASAKIPDHVLQFASSDLLKATQDAAGPVKSVQLNLTWSVIRSADTPWTSSLIVRTQPLPENRTGPVAIQSTILLI
jgi:hypothetical protein